MKIIVGQQNNSKSKNDFIELPIIVWDLLANLYNFINNKHRNKSPIIP